jgi:hypothetical protein
MDRSLCMDLIYVGLIAAFFALTWGLTELFEALRGDKE